CDFAARPIVPLRLDDALPSSTLQRCVDRQTGTPHGLCHVRALREGRFHGVFIDRSTQSPDMKFRPDLLTVRLCRETNEVVLAGRSEEHTSELQSRETIVFRLL